MARAATTSDVFNAIAEPRRRQIVELLARRGTLAAGAIVAALGLPQPTVSKHLAVLSQVGVVSAAAQGRQRLYRLEPAELKAVHDWTRQLERFWSHQLDRVKARAEQKAKERSNSHNTPSAKKGE